jgi:hypothetical protein
MVGSVHNVSSDQDYDTSFADGQSSVCGSGLNVAYGPSRRVPYMQDIDGVVARSVENPEWIANNGDDPNWERCETRGAALGAPQMRSMTLSNRCPIASAIAGLALAE